MTKKVVTRRDVFDEDNTWDWNIHQYTAILINNEVKEVVVTLKIAEMSTEESYDISPQVLKEIIAPDQPLSCACIRPT